MRWICVGITPEVAMAKLIDGAAQVIFFDYMHLSKKLATINNPNRVVNARKMMGNSVHGRN